MTVPAALPREAEVKIKEKRPERGTATPDFPLLSVPTPFLLSVFV